MQYSSLWSIMTAEVFGLEMEFWVFNSLLKQNELEIKLKSLLSSAPGHSLTDPGAFVYNTETN